MKYHTFRKVKYKVEFTSDLPADCMGTCERPVPEKRKMPKLKIREGMSLEETKTTALHEALHACLWDLSEDAVVETEEDVMRFVDRAEAEWHKRNGK